jgi:hypothetical protein
MTRLQCFVKESKAGFISMGSDFDKFLKEISIILTICFLIFGFLLPALLPVLVYTIILSLFGYNSGFVGLAGLGIAILSEYPWIKCIFIPAANCMLKLKEPVDV